MSQASVISFSQEELNNLAAGNARWFALAGMTLCRACDMSPKAYWTYFGSKFADAWADDSDKRAYGIMANAVSIGFDLRDSVSGEEAITAVFGGGPSTDELAYFEMTPEEADAIWHIFDPIAAALGHNYRWQRLGNEITVTITRR